MSVCTSDEARSSATPRSQPNALESVISNPQNEITYRRAINQIRSAVESALGNRVHVYSFNVHPYQLQSAYNLLDKVEARKSMRVTYSNDHNFVVRYMPSPVHEIAHVYWAQSVTFALSLLTPPPHVMAPGCLPTGSTTYQLGPRRKEPDSGLMPANSTRPSVVVEVGSSESLMQLKIDASLWIEHMPEVRLVILVSIDLPTAALPNLPRIKIQLWRGIPPRHPPCSTAGQQRVADMVWECDWTHAATPLYILLDDIFRGQVPAAYGNHDRVHLDTVAWRQVVVDRWRNEVGWAEC